MMARVSSKFPQNPVTNGRSLWRFGVSPGIGFKSCYPGRRCGRAERGDSAYGPNAQRRTSARHTLRQVWENRPRGSQGPLNRDSGMLLEVLYRSVQRGGNSGETLGSSDSPIMVAQACFTQEGAALPSKALALPFSRRPVGRSRSRKLLERGSWRGGKARSRRVVHQGLAPCGQ